MSIFEKIASQSDFITNINTVLSLLGSKKPKTQKDRIVKKIIEREAEVMIHSIHHNYLNNEQKFYKKLIYLYRLAQKLK